MIKHFFTTVFLLATSTLFSQIVVNKPFAAEQSHPELSIDLISFYADSTVVQLTVVNKLDKGGWFCADRDIYLENPLTRQRYSLIGSIGIPTCPNTHNFKRKDDKLSFTLLFPALPFGLRTLNLVENCNKACFSFRGIILNEKLNNDIRTFNQGMEFYTANKIDQAVACFVKVIEEIPSIPTHVYGYSYYHLILIHRNKGDELTAKFWLEQLERSSLPDKQYFMDAAQKSKNK